MLVVLDPGSGQMCNQMLMQMNILASAYQHSYKVVYYGFRRYNGPVYTSDGLDGLILEKEKIAFVRSKIANFVLSICRKLKVNSKKVILGSDSKCVDYFLKATNKNRKKYWCVGWPFYDLDSLRKNADLIRSYFSPNEEVMRYVSSNMSRFSSDDLIVGVHMRRGDYKTWRGGEFYFDDYVYKKYMDKLFKELKKKAVHFILFSNEKININNFETKEYKVSIANGSAIQDFYLMSKCDYIIGPPSSYNGLASFLGGVPRFVVLQKDDVLTLDGMYIWLQETDGWVNSI